MEKSDLEEGSFDSPRYINLPYQLGDILYVRETWAPMYQDDISKEVVGYMYKADDGRMTVEDYDRLFPNGKKWAWTGIWHPSIHMPKEAARIWLKVTDVRVERLQDMRIEDFLAEGILGAEYDIEIKNRFVKLWNSTLKKSDIARYGWDANPWVWVIEFERCERPWSE